MSLKIFLWLFKNRNVPLGSDHLDESSDRVSHGLGSGVELLVPLSWTIAKFSETNTSSSQRIIATVEA